MNPADQYLAHARSLYFTWDESGQELCWDNHLLIAFRKELATVIDRLAPDGLPPLSAISVLLSATRSNWPEARWFLELWRGAAGSEYAADLFAFTSGARARCEEILDHLDRLHELTEPYRDEPRMRAEVAAMVFTPATNRIRGGWTDEVIAEFRSGLRPAVRSPGGLLIDLGAYEEDLIRDNATEKRAYVSLLKQSARQLFNDLQSLLPGLVGVEAQGLERQIKTGLRNGVGPAEESRTGELLRKLRGHADHGGLADLAARLVPMIQFARRLKEDSDVPVGGLSDFTNRGRPEHLLLSELAYDDLTMAVRIVSGEAMYLRREKPRMQAQRACHVLIDTGLYSWGMPRLFETGVALALASQRDAEQMVTLMHLRDGRPAEVDFSTVEGLDEHLSVLSPELTCGSAIEKFVTLSRERANNADEQRHVIVTTLNALQDESFAASVRRQASSESLHVIAVSAEGRFEHREYSSRGMRRVRSTRLDLSALLDDAEAHRLRRTPGYGNYPAILTEPGFPFRLPHAPAAARTVSTSVGAMTLTGDGRLMLWQTRQAAALQLTDNAGKGGLLWYGPEKSGKITLVCGKLRPGGIRICVVDLPTRSVSVNRLNCDWQPVRVAGFGGFVFLMGVSRIAMYSARQAEMIGEKQWSEPHWRVGRLSGENGASARFIRRHKISGHIKETEGWWAVVGGADGPDLVEVPVPPDAVRVFDVVDKGVAAICRHQHDTDVTNSRRQSRRSSQEGCFLWRTWESDRRRVQAIRMNEADFQGVSADGRRVFYREGTQGRVLNVETLQTGASDCPEIGLFRAGRSFQLIRDRSLRKRFRAVSYTNQNLLLRGIDRRHLIITARRCVAEASTPHAAEFHPFEAAEAPDGAEYTLSVARLSPTIQIWLDSRGLVHLTDAEKHLADMTILLREGPLCYWSADGGYVGVGVFDASNAEEPDQIRDTNPPVTGKLPLLLQWLELLGGPHADLRA